MGLIHGKKSNTTYPINVIGGDKSQLAGILEVVSINVYPRQKFDYTNTSLCVYMGFNKRYDASSTDTDWIIVKRKYNADNLPEEHQILVGAWSNRGGLSWAF